jgi:nucleoside-diphosphate-sugar epimerase
MTGRLVAVTGASGFLGAHVVVALAAAGARIRVLAHRRPPHPLWQNLPVEFYAGNVTDPDACARFAAGTDAVIHAAGLIKAVRDTDFATVNTQGTAHLAQSVRDAGPDSRLVLVSSLAVREPQLSPYAASKWAGEQAAAAVFSEAPQRLVILRPPALYGPWDREGLVLFKTAGGRVAPVFGNGRIALMHVQDAADAIARLALHPATGTYALAGPGRAAITARQLIEAVARAVGGHPRLVPIPAPLLIAAGALLGGLARLRGKAEMFTAGKARELLHQDWTVSADEVLPPTLFSPAIDLQEGISGTAAWYKAEGWL